MYRCVAVACLPLTQRKCRWQAVHGQTTCVALPLQEHYEAEKRKAESRAEFEAEQAYLKTLSLLRWVHAPPLLRACPACLRL